MAYTKMGASAPVANTLTTVYTVPALKTAKANIIVTNSGISSAEFDLAVSTLATPTTSEYIASNVVIPAGGIFELKDIYLSADELIVVKASTGYTSIRVHGDLV